MVFPQVSNMFYAAFRLKKKKKSTKLVPVSTNPHRRLKYTETQITLKYAWALELCTHKDSLSTFQTKLSSSALTELAEEAKPFCRALKSAKPGSPPKTVFRLLQLLSHCPLCDTSLLQNPKICHY